MRSRTIVFLALLASGLAFTALGLRISAEPRASAEARAASSTALDPTTARALDDALVEARGNALEAAELERALDLAHPRSVVLETRALDRALGERAIARALGRRELDALLVASRFVNALGDSLRRGPDRARSLLDAERLTAEDARFLIEAIFARLRRISRTDALTAEPSPPTSFETARLVQFRGQSFEAALESFAR